MQRCFFCMCIVKKRGELLPFLCFLLLFISPPHKKTLCSEMRTPCLTLYSLLFCFSSLFLCLFLYFSTAIRFIILDSSLSALRLVASFFPTCWAFFWMMLVFARTVQCDVVYSFVSSFGTRKMRNSCVRKHKPNFIFHFRCRFC